MQSSWEPQPRSKVQTGTFEFGHRLILKVSSAVWKLKEIPQIPLSELLSSLTSSLFEETKGKHLVNVRYDILLDEKDPNDLALPSSATLQSTLFVSLLSHVKHLCDGKSSLTPTNIIRQPNYAIQLRVELIPKEGCLRHTTKEGETSSLMILLCFGLNLLSLNLATTRRCM